MISNDVNASWTSAKSMSFGVMPAMRYARSAAIRVGSNEVKVFRSRSPAGPGDSEIGIFRRDQHRRRAVRYGRAIVKSQRRRDKLAREIDLFRDRLLELREGVARAVGVIFHRHGAERALQV